ncbi:FecR family protein [Parapedobacter sp. ISTM3]|uniref:FecR family protein n=1 Tax=Parapedobacter sp. ISTM3 TaxID=2800130 RepID=UPI0019073F54|nr:FecR domain-containing protein [Parapedobacter sp. ISTM3]MBK1439249.1 FecR family protein [Parapedobacter sp. ISTM3]
MSDPENKRIEELARKWAAGKISEGEMKQLDNWFLEGNEGAQSWPGEDRDAESLQARLRGRLMRDVSRRSAAVRYIRRGAVAAALLLAIGVSYQLIKREAVETPEGNAAVMEAIVPGKDRAYLTLSSGKTVELASDQETLVVEGEQLQYANGRPVGAELDGDSADWNTIQVPNGGKYKVRLPDGTLVWLNAGSSLRFPSSFTETGRAVALSGEAYFDVAKQTDANNRRIPFMVRTKHQSVEVLGTQFNINAYEDEATTRTTLLEGSIHVHVGTQEYVVRPLQEAVLHHGSTRVQVGATDTLEAVAWKNGLFRFKGLDIHGVMKQVSRWYDVEVQFAESIQNRRLTGYVSRDLPIHRVLAMLEEVGEVTVDIEDRILYVRRGKREQQNK